MQESPTSALGRGRSQQTQQRFLPDETNLFHFLSSVSEAANYCFTFQQRDCRPCRRLNPASKTHAGLKRSCIRSQMCTLHTHTHPHVEVLVCSCVCTLLCVCSCVCALLCVCCCVCGVRIPAGKTFKPVNLTGATGDRIEAPRLNDAGLFSCAAQIKPSSVNALKHPLTGHRINGGNVEIKQTHPSLRRPLSHRAAARANESDK